MFSVGSGAGAAAEAGERGAKTVGHQGGADLVVVVTAGHLGHGLDVADVLGHKHEHDGQEHRQDGEVGLRQVELREADPCGVINGGEVDLAAEAGINVADDHADQNIESTKQSLEQHGDKQHGQQSHDCGIRRGLEIGPYGGCQIEADNGHDRTVDHRRHDDVDPLGTGVMHEHADQSQQDTGAHDAEAGDRDALVGGGDCGDRGDEAEGRAQIAWQHVLVDEQEQCGGHGGEEQGGGRIKARENRHQEGGAEHSDDVLRTDAGGAGPSQALVRLDHLAGPQRLAVAMQLPLEDIGHYYSPRSRRQARHTHTSDRAVRHCIS